MSQQIYNLSFELEVVKTKKEINTNDIVSQNKMWIRILFFFTLPLQGGISMVQLSDTFGSLSGLPKS